MFELSCFACSHRNNKKNREKKNRRINTDKVLTFKCDKISYRSRIKTLNDYRKQIMKIEKLSQGAGCKTMNKTALPSVSSIPFFPKIMYLRSG